MSKVLEIAKAIGITADKEEDVTVDAVVSHINSTYTPTDKILSDENIKEKIIGKTLGSVTVKAAQKFNLTKADYEGKKLEEVFDIAASKFNAELEKAKADAGKDTDTRVTELTKKIGKLESELENKEQLRLAAVTENEKITSEFNGKIKSFKLNDKLGKALSGIKDKFTDEYHKNDLVNAGFNKYVNDNYTIDLNDKDELVVISKADNKPVSSKKAAGKLMDVEELYTTLAEEKGVLKKNPGMPDFKKVVTKTDNGGGEGNKVKVHPRAVANAERK